MAGVGAHGISPQAETAVTTVEAVQERHASTVESTGISASPLSAAPDLKLMRKAPVCPKAKSLRAAGAVVRYSSNPASPRVAKPTEAAAAPYPPDVNASVNLAATWMSEGSSARSLRNDGFAARDLLAAGYPLDEVIDAGCAPTDLQGESTMQSPQPEPTPESPRAASSSSLEERTVPVQAQTQQTSDHHLLADLLADIYEDDDDGSPEASHTLLDTANIAPKSGPEKGEDETDNHGLTVPVTAGQPDNGSDAEPDVLVMPLAAFNSEPKSPELPISPHRRVQSTTDTFFSPPPRTSSIRASFSSTTSHISQMRSFRTSRYSRSELRQVTYKTGHGVPHLLAETTLAEGWDGGGGILVGPDELLDEGDVYLLIRVQARIRGCLTRLRLAELVAGRAWRGKRSSPRVRMSVLEMAGAPEHRLPPPAPKRLQPPPVPKRATPPPPAP